MDITEVSLAPAVTNNRKFQFADLMLDPTSGEVWRGENILALPKLSFQLLLVLAENSPSTLNQEQLILLIWKDNVVGDETLKQRVKLLRKALGDNAQNPKYIGVVRGRGYRLLPPVRIIIYQTKDQTQYQTIFNERVPSLASEEGMKLWKRMSVGLSLVLVVSFIFLYMLSNQLELQNEHANFADREQPAELSQAFGYFLKGKNYYQRYKEEDNQIAIQLFQHALKLEPNLAIAHAGLADAYSQGVFQFGEDDSWRRLALESAKNAVRLEPDNEIAHKALGLAEYLNGQLEKAIVSNLKAVQLNPDFLQANTNLGFIYRELGQLELALQWNYKTIKIDPFYAPGYLHLAQSYQAQKKYELAERNFIKALELKPDYQLAKDAYLSFLARRPPKSLKGFG